MKYEQIIKQYYQSYKDADKEALREILTPDFKHISPDISPRNFSLSKAKVKWRRKRT